MASFQEQYDSLIEQLQEKGVPQPRILVPAVAALALLAALFFTFTSLAPSTVSIQFTLQAADGTSVPNAAVTLLAGQKQFSATSDANGAVLFKNVPPNQKLQVSIRASGFPDETQPIAYDSATVTLRALPTPTQITFSAQVLDDQRVPVQDAQVRFSPDTGAASSDVTDSFGNVQAKFSGIQSVVVGVSKEGFKSQSKNVLLSDQKNVEIVLAKIDVQPSATPPATPLVLVSVSDDKGNAVQGVKVTLLDATTQTTLGTASTDSSGQSRLDFLNPNQKFTVSVTDSQHRYADYASPYPIAAGPDPVLVTLSSAPPNGQLVVVVKDKAGNSVSDATVSAYDSAHANWITSIASDASGRAALTLDAPLVHVTIYHDGFLPASFSSTNKQSHTVVLDSSDGKTVHINVTVQNNLDPAAQANVQVFSSDGFPLGVPDQTAAADGTASFDVPKSSNAIYAKASLGSLNGHSDRAVAQSDINWVISLLPPDLPFKVNVIDAVTEKPVSGAVVRFVTTAEKAKCTTSDGSCQAIVPAQTEFHLVVESAAYLPFESTVQLASADSANHPFQAKLYPKALTQNAVVNFQGFFTEAGAALRETSNAQSVQARFLVTLPSATGDDTARFTVRLADSVPSPASITTVDGTDKFYTGSDPQAACNPPTTDNATDHAQWAVFEFPKGFSGTQQATVHFFIDPAAKPPSVMTLSYDLHGLRKSVPFLYPLDSQKLQQLVSQSSVADKDFCGQASVIQRLPISHDVMTCQDSYCAKIIFTRPDGTRSADSAQLLAGQTFGIDVSLVGLKNGISQVQVSAPAAIQLVSFQPQSGSSTNLTTSNFDSSTSKVPAQNSLTLATPAAKQEKINLHIEAAAARATQLAQITFSIQDTDGASTDLNRQVLVSGTNRITAIPSVASLDATIAQNFRVLVKDQFNKPVTDATVDLYECDGTPLNGQTIPASDSNGGSYSFKVQPSSIGTVGIRVSQPQFQPYENCALPVTSTDFLSAEPQSVTLKGDTKAGSVSQTVTLSSVLNVKSQVSSNIQCTDSNGSSTDVPLILSPKTLSLKDTATVTLQAIKQTYRGQCQITFLAKVNKDNLASAQVSVDVQITGPPRADQLCPVNQTGVKCLSTTDATALHCTKNAFVCDDPTLSCFQCNLGPQTLPSQISLSVSNYQTDDTQTYAVALEGNPDECRVEGFTNNPINAPYGSNFQTPFSPYGFQGGYGAPNSYYNYQPNPYTPYSTNPFLGSGSCLPYGAGYGAGVNGYPNAYSGVLPSGYAGANGYYPGAPGIVPAPANAANPATAVSNCQTIISKLSPQCQVYFTQYSAYNTNQNFYGGGYRDPWANSLTPGFQSNLNYQYPQSRPTVRVSADCTQTQIKVTGSYAGGDATYGGQLGGNQQGYLAIRTNGQTQQIPITVTVQTPFTGGYPGSYPGGYPGTFGGGYPSGYPSNQIPPQCIAEYQRALVQAATPSATPQDGLDESGLPDTIDVYYNRYNGQGTYERDLKAPAGGTLQVVKPQSNQVKLDASNTKIRVSVKCTRKKADADLDCPSDLTFKATWTFANIQAVQKDRTIHLVADDFQPAAVQMLLGANPKDTALLDVSTSGDFSKAKCSGPNIVRCRPSESTISADASSVTKDAQLQVSALGDYQIRSVPVRVSKIDPSDANVVLNAGQEKKISIKDPLLVNPTVDVVNDKGSSLKDYVTVTAAKDSLTIKAKDNAPSALQKGTLTFSFDDSSRKNDFRPLIYLAVGGKDTSGSITITAGTTHAVNEAFSIFYAFPSGDEPTKRKVTLTLTPPGGSPQQPTPIDYTKLQYSGTNGINLPYTATAAGTLSILAEGELNSKAISQSVSVIITPAAAGPAAPAPEGPNAPKGKEDKPPAAPAAPSLIKSVSLDVTDLHDDLPKGSFSIKIKLADEKTLNSNGVHYPLYLYLMPTLKDNAVYNSQASSTQLKNMPAGTLVDVIYYKVDSAPSANVVTISDYGGYALADYNGNWGLKVDTPAGKVGLPMTGENRLANYYLNVRLGSTDSKDSNDVKNKWESKTPFRLISKTQGPRTVGGSGAPASTQITYVSKIVKKYSENSYDILLVKNGWSNDDGLPVTLSFTGFTRTLTLHYLYKEQAHVRIFSGTAVDWNNLLRCGYYGRGNDLRLYTSTLQALTSNAVPATLGYGGVLVAYGFTAGLTGMALLTPPGWLAAGVFLTTAAVGYLSSGPATCENAGLTVTLMGAGFSGGYQSGWGYGKGYENSRVMLHVQTMG